MDRINKFLQKRQLKNKRTILWNNERYEITKEDLKKVRNFRNRKCLDPTFVVNRPRDLSFSSTVREDPIEKNNANDKKSVERAEKTIQRLKEYYRKHPIKKKEPSTKNSVVDVWENDNLETLRSFEQEWIYSIKEAYNKPIEECEFTREHLKEEMRRIFLRQFKPRDLKEKKISEIIPKLPDEKYLRPYPEYEGKSWKLKKVKLIAGSMAYVESSFDDSDARDGKCNAGNCDDGKCNAGNCDDGKCNSNDGGKCNSNDGGKCSDDGGKCDLGNINGNNTNDNNTADDNTIHLEIWNLKFNFLVQKLKVPGKISKIASNQMSTVVLIKNKVYSVVTDSIRYKTNGNPNLELLIDSKEHISDLYVKDNLLSILINKNVKVYQMESMKLIYDVKIKHEIPKMIKIFENKLYVSSANGLLIYDMKDKEKMNKESVGDKESVIKDNTDNKESVMDKVYDPQQSEPVPLKMLDYVVDFDVRKNEICALNNLNKLIVLDPNEGIKKNISQGSFGRAVKVHKVLNLYAVLFNEEIVIYKYFEGDFIPVNTITGGFKKIEWDDEMPWLFTVTAGGVVLFT